VFRLAGDPLVHPGVVGGHPLLHLPQLGLEPALPRLRRHAAAVDAGHAGVTFPTAGREADGALAGVLHRFRKAVDRTGKPLENRAFRAVDPDGCSDAPRLLTDPALARVVAAWPTLSEPIRGTILVLIETAQPVEVGTA
jgi:hypothetical protein